MPGTSKALALKVTWEPKLNPCPMPCTDLHVLYLNHQQTLRIKWHEPHFQTQKPGLPKVNDLAQSSDSTRQACLHLLQQGFSLRNTLLIESSTSAPRKLLPCRGFETVPPSEAGKKMAMESQEQTFFLFLLPSSLQFLSVPGKSLLYPPTHLAPEKSQESFATLFKQH